MPLNTDSRTTPTLMARYAREFYDAAIAADNVLGHRKGFELRAPVPVMYLIAHSIELSLKSFLLQKGEPINALKNNFGHDLLKLLHRAKEYQLNEIYKASKEQILTLKYLNQLYLSKELNYMKTGYKEFPSFGPIDRLAHNLGKEIGLLVGLRQWR